MKYININILIEDCVNVVKIIHSYAPLNGVNSINIEIFNNTIKQNILWNFKEIYDYL